MSDDRLLEACFITRRRMSNHILSASEGLLHHRLSDIGSCKLSAAGGCQIIGRRRLHHRSVGLQIINYLLLEA